MRNDEAIAQMQEAVRLEKQAVLRDLSGLGQRGKLTIRKGRRVHAEPGAQGYVLECGDSLPIPEGTRVRLQVPGQMGVGEILFHDPDAEAIHCVIREDLGPDIPGGSLEFDSTYLLDLLEQRLEALKTGEAMPPGSTAPSIGLAWDFLNGSATRNPPETVDVPRLTPTQAAVVAFALGQRVTYIWGPPGTGKTETIAALVHRLVEKGEKVLLVAHTNIAVDNVLIRVLRHAAVPPGWAIRVGFPGEGLQKFDVDLDTQADRSIRRHEPDLVGEIVTIFREVTALHPSAIPRRASEKTPLPRLLRIASDVLEVHGAGPDATVTSRLTQLARRVETHERRVLEEAQVVAATLTRCYTSRLLAQFRTDVLLVDEASMASATLCFVSACLARKRAIAVGDFMQLPTIVQNEHPLATHWLGRHVFRTSGADEVQDDHPLRVLLEEQWRMQPAISFVVSQTFYGGRLKDAPVRRAEARRGPSILLLDSTRAGARSESTSDGSKRNAVHAGIVAGLLAIIDKGAFRSAAVITPYRAQSRLIRQLSRETSPKLLESERYEIFTVHRFQGRDSPLVIFDVTEAPGTRCRFLNEVLTEHAPNLVNVALSRAKEKLIVLAPFEHLEESLSSRSMMMDVLRRARESGGIELEAGCDEDHAALESFLMEN